VQFSGPRAVELVECEQEPLIPGTVRVRTRYSGISAGTELTAYRGSNPYLNETWEPRRRVFLAGAPTFAYPVSGWGYSEVGEVVEAAEDVASPRPGQLVYGIWGHRSDAVVPAEAVAGNVLDDGRDPIEGIFARVGAIALNAVLAAEVHLGDRVAIFGQGVIGLLATRLATLSGAGVVAVDGYPHRLEVSREMGALDVLPADAPGGAGAQVRAWTGHVGADGAIELSGSYRALHEAVRCVAVDGTVVAAGFYQGGAGVLRLGEEFHHNRVRIVASQISATPIALGARWNPRRLVTVFMEQVAAGRVDVKRLVTDVVPASAVGAAFQRLDQGDPDTLQVALSFDGEASR
jgi:2-desacetyl-2-hydroxyethyl bacteriochlorophyllide A dehydrogenase